MGFAQNEGFCADQVEGCVNEFGISSGSTRMEGGTLDIHRDLEKKVAKFVGKEDSIIVSMGFATNSTTIPSLVGKVKKKKFVCLFIIYLYFCQFFFIGLFSH